MKKIIQVDNVIKKYKHFQLGPITTQITEGKIIGITGYHGSGKTAFLHILLGLSKLNSGNIKCETNHMGVVLEDTFFPSVYNANDIHFIMEGIYTTWDASLFFQMLEKHRIAIDTPIEKMTLSTQRKLQIITAISHHPDILILDDVTHKLDPITKKEIIHLLREFIKSHAHTVLYSTRTVSDLHQIADEIIFLDHGMIIFQGQEQEILKTYAVLRCHEQELSAVSKEDYRYFSKHKHQYKLLVKDMNHMKKKYPQFNITSITLDEFMTFIGRGEHV